MADITQRILQFNHHRDPEKVLLKYKAIRESSFRFLRGTCHLFYEDLGNQFTLPPSPNSWLCGDLHLENFGSFKGSDKEDYFDIGDFDEAILGPALYDLSRLLVSVLAACKNSAYEKSWTDSLLNTAIGGYCRTLKSGKPVTVENKTASGLVKILLEKVAGRNDKELVKDKAGKESGYEKLIIDNKKTFSLETSFKKELLNKIQDWLDETRGKNRRKIHDVAFNIAGTGSIGVNRYLALVSDTTADKKYLLVIKQALASSLQPFIQVKQPGWANDAERINQVQFMMQHATPGGLRILSFRNNWYITKWVQPEADKINFDNFLEEKKEQPVLMDTLGCLAASAHLRSGGRDGSAIADDMIRFGTQQEWIQPLLAFAETYAAQVEKDYEKYCVAYDKGL
ncbi:MAG TPA: DUF2252 family protein [Chitinophagaceae bacterium]|nr:DUF2252 family protein [Chitinophagaceae bacterium]